MGNDPHLRYQPQTVDGGLVFTFPPGTAFIGRLSEATASELACCPFYAFTVTHDVTATTMTVRAPGYSAEVVTQFSGDAD
ncbi:hypothetical protein CH289_04930 [Rhodococcus sp. RS1C4]|nr:MULTISPECIES: hypothetical protein [unclassified Rhodococcus (in: high G+C Gram-positive bacteria)]OZC56666.1 hypothetical protein CH289_04930 [Rhodococcus sp. RS1C4]OZC86169.1 hypothetical protein CH282_12015 [Rhodococcus sp. 06-418-1B]